jgi:hypothetical protein
LRKSLQISFAIGTVACGCFAAPLIPVAPSDAPIVIIGRTSARFIFPRESTAVLSWDIPTNDSYEGSPEHVWSANWEIAEDRLGKDPDGLSAAVRYKKGRNRKGPLSELVAAAETTVNTTCMSCGDIPAYIPKEDPAVKASAIDGRVVITIKGSAAVQRVFRVIPDSVYLERYAPGGDRIGFWEVGVRRQ